MKESAVTTLLVVALLGLPPRSSVAEPPGPPARVGGAIQEPRKVKSVAPKYPEDARRAGLGGAVILECTISPKGDVVEMIVRQGVPPLTDAARKAVMEWKYTPTLLDGVAVPVIMTVTVNFKMETGHLHDLLGSLRHRNEHIREAAARNLGILKVGGSITVADKRDAIQALEPLAEKDESPRVRLAAARSLSRLDGRLPSPAVALPPPDSPAPPPAAAPDRSPRPVAWGTFVDPLGQCRIEEREGRLEIEVPAGAYDLSIELGQVTAPRLMQLVDGDHVVQVTVNELPEPTPPLAGQPRLPYHGAGLLLWQDERSYVRLEAAILRRGESGVRYALFEVRTDGKVVGDLAGTDVRLQSGPADLRLERRGKDLLALVRQGDEAWREAGRAQVDLPRTVAVGVTAVNTARSPFRAGFTRFDLLREPGTALPLDASSPASPAPAGDAAPGLADSDSAPKPLRMTKPLYPQEAFQKKIQGTVLVEILIDSAGRVACSRILESVPGLDEAALDCIRGWQFTPARKGGQAVPTIAHVPVVFRIGSGPAPPPP